MAPLTFDQIVESLSSHESVLTVQDCISKANSIAFGTFFVGLSGGLALQVQYPRFMPKSPRAFFVLPLALGTGTALSVQHYLVGSCMKKWKEASATTATTESDGCAYSNGQQQGETITL